MRVILAILICLSISSFAYAKGGFKGPNATQTMPNCTVSDVLSAHDDYKCVLTGKIVSKVPGDDDEYMFQDSTGKLVVEIDDDVFRNIQVSPKNTVKLYGEVDEKRRKDNEFEAKHLEVVK